MPNPVDPSNAVDRNLLYAIMALRVGFITPDALISTLLVWVRDKSVVMADLLVSLGYMSADDCALLAPLVDTFVKRHDGNVVQALASLSSIEPLLAQIQGIVDPEIHATLTCVKECVEGNGGGATLVDAAFSGKDQTQKQQERFRILRFHKNGGLGKVSVALDTELGREVAFKEIREDVANQPHLRERFLQEAEITGSLQHPGIMPIYGLGRYADGRPYYAMRFIQGKSLHESIRAFHDRDDWSVQERRQTLRRMIERFIDVCDAVGYAHSRGVLHRDLKPGNIMLGEYGETLVVDWGMAKSLRRNHEPNSVESDANSSALNDGNLTADGTALGSPAFMSPEQAQGRLDEFGPATDVFGLGATLYALLTGVAPYNGEKQEDVLGLARKTKYVPVLEMYPSCPRALAEICQRAMSTRPDDRYPTAGALRDDLSKWLADEPINNLLDVVRRCEQRYELEKDDRRRKRRYQGEFARELTSLSRVYQAMGRLDDAVASAERAVHLLEGSYDTDPGEDSHLTGLRIDEPLRDPEHFQLFSLHFTAREQLVIVLRGSGRNDDINELEIEQDKARRLIERATFSSDEWDGRDPLSFVPFEPMPGKLKSYPRSGSLVGPYKLVSKFGQGAYGNVYRARDLQLPRFVAIKLVHRELLTETDTSTLSRNAAKVALLDHPNIVKVIGVGEEGTFVYIASEYIEGVALERWIKTHSKHPDAQESIGLAQWCHSLAVALHHAHTYIPDMPVIHGDVNPSNILVDAEGKLRLLDFGLPKRRLQERIATGESMFVASVAYIAPELVEGKPCEADVRSDIYSLGVVLFELLTRYRPYRGSSEVVLSQLKDPRVDPPSPRSLNRHVPRDLELICLKCLQKEPSRRYASAKDLADDLERFLNDEPVEARPPMWLVSVWDSFRFRKWWPSK